MNSIGVGKQGKNNGVLIVLCPACRRIEIITGVGIEKTLKDSTVQRIINRIILPAMKADGYFKGIYDGSIEIINFLEKPENKI